MMSFNFRKSLFLKLVAAFVFATIIGTLTHEAGHWLIARQYAEPGTATINYRSVDWKVPGGPGDSLDLFAGKTGFDDNLIRLKFGLIENYKTTKPPDKGGFVAIKLLN